jgi:hypothetical protein
MRVRCELSASLLLCLKRVLALRAEFRLIVLQALLSLLALLPLAQLLNLGFARLLGGVRLSRLAATLARRLCLSACAGDQGCDEYD